MEEEKLTIRKKILFSFIAVVVGLFLVLLFGELMVRIFNPQVICFPRSSFSEKYGMIWKANQKIINELPGRWKFVYTTNQYNSRGPGLEISNRYPKKNIVVLGDSYSFGNGVNDQEEYPSIMAKNLEQEYDIINLGNSGWGLTQEIRRFYDFGQLYLPKIVVLQFCRNDPSENFLFNVTRVEGSRFVFVNYRGQIGRFKRYLSNSFIQKSSLYNLVRVFFRRYFSKKTIEANVKKEKNSTSQEKISSIEETFYNDLLDLFARDLNQRGIELVLISINNELNEFPLIKKKIEELESLQLLDYQETEEWFTCSKKYNSPEGHRWGKKAHEIVGNKLSEVILKKSSSPLHYLPN